MRFRRAVGALLTKNPHMHQRARKRRVGDGAREGAGRCKRENRNSSWQEEKLSLETREDSPARGSHQAEAEEP